MPIEESRGLCPDCRRSVLIKRAGVSHLAHALITLFLCGLWWPLWLLACCWRDPWLCSRCGAECEPEESVPLHPAVIVPFGIAALNVLAFLAVAGFLGAAAFKH